MNTICRVFWIFHSLNMALLFTIIFFALFLLVRGVVGILALFSSIILFAVRFYEDEDSEQKGVKE